MEVESSSPQEENEMDGPRKKHCWGKNCFVCGRKFARIGLPTDKDEERKLLWCKLLNVPPPPDSRKKKICEQHFKPGDISFGENRIRIKPDALPLPFNGNPPENEQIIPHRFQSNNLIHNLRIHCPEEDSFKYKDKEETIQNILNFMYSKSLETSDVSIYCKDGTLFGHKLVLASISPMLYGALKNHIGDDSDETSGITMEEVSSESSLLISFRAPYNIGLTDASTNLCPIKVPSLQ